MTVQLKLLADLLNTHLTRVRNPSLTDMALEALSRDLPAGYPWPGNVHELEQAVRRVLLTGSYTAETVSPTSERKDDISGKMRAGAMSAKDLIGK